MSLVVTSGPASEPLTTAEAKKQLEIETSVSEHDIFIDSLIKEARQYVEQKIGIGLFTQTVVQRWDEFPECTRFDKFPALELCPGNIQSITHLKYLDTDGAEQALADTTDYKESLTSIPSQLVPAYSKSWPATRNEIDAVWCEYVRGWGTTAEIPGQLKGAMLMIITSWFECRNDSVRRFPTAADLLIDQYRENYL